jgi:transcriptional regulator GlxA family with amidase domain
MYRELVLPRVRMFVEAFWSLEVDTPAARRILPDGCIDFLFDLDRGTGSVIGTMKTSQLVATPAGARRFGVRFAPGGAMPFIDAHAHELTDRKAGLSELTRAAAFDLAERVAEAPDERTRALLVADFLEDRRSRLRATDARVRRATEEVRANAGRVAIPTLARRLDLGERQLERLFREQVGSGPKLFARVVRMQRALALLETRTEYRGERALDAGFADEPHLVREFRALTGVTPRLLFLERNAMSDSSNRAR